MLLARGTGLCGSGAPRAAREGHARTRRVPCGVVLFGGPGTLVRAWAGGSVGRGGSGRGLSGGRGTLRSAVGGWRCVRACVWRGRVCRARACRVCRVCVVSRIVVSCCVRAVYVCVCVCVCVCVLFVFCVRVLVSRGYVCARGAVSGRWPGRVRGRGGGAGRGGRAVTKFDLSKGKTQSLAKVAPFGCAHGLPLNKRFVSKRAPGERLGKSVFH